MPQRTLFAFYNSSSKENCFKETTAAVEALKQKSEPPAKPAKKSKSRASASSGRDAGERERSPSPVMVRTKRRLVIESEDEDSNASASAAEAASEVRKEEKLTLKSAVKTSPQPTASNCSPGKRKENQGGEKEEKKEEEKEEKEKEKEKKENEKEEKEEKEKEKEKKEEKKEKEKEKKEKEKKKKEAKKEEEKKKREEKKKEKENKKNEKPKKEKEEEEKKVTAKEDESSEDSAGAATEDVKPSKRRLESSSDEEESAVKRRKLNSPKSSGATSDKISNLASSSSKAKGSRKANDQKKASRTKKSDGAGEKMAKVEVEKEEVEERKTKAEGAAASPEKKVEAKPQAAKPLKSAFGALTAPASEQKVYEPGKAKYHPIDDAIWKQGEKVPYLALARTFECIEAISGRLKIVEMLCNLFRSIIVLSPRELLPCIYLCLNKVAAAYEGIELGIGDSILMKALGLATGASMDKIKTVASERGDLGLAAEVIRCKQRVMFAPAKLTVPAVFDKLKEIASMSGHSSQAKKIEKIQSLLVACRQSESRYLIRCLGGKLRIGLAEQSVLQALGHAVAMTPPGQEFPPAQIDCSKGHSSEKWKEKADEIALIIKTTYCECPNYDQVIAALLEFGPLALPEHCKLTPGVPLKPMLAHPTKGVTEVMRRFDAADFTCEYKYDGERAQIHVWTEQQDGEAKLQVRIYSRNQEDNTSKYPDLVSLMPRALEGCDVQSCIIDSEAVAWDRAKKQILPFQVLSTRKRKDAKVGEIQVQVCIYAFDILFFNGEPLIRKSLRDRRRILREQLKEVEGEFVFAQALDSSDTSRLAEFLDESIKDNCEGLMVKSLDRDATYEIAKRSHNWLKLKKDYLEGVGDTLDLVVIGGYHGTGKRAGRYGGFLLACYDADNEEFQSICKIGTGFKDEDLEKHTSILKEMVIPRAKSYYRFDSSSQPDHWFEATVVWEVKAADLSISPAHQAALGLVDPEKGVSLRFPRFLRVRDDKSPEDATSAQQVAQMYNSQEQIKNQEAKVVEDPEDYF